MIDNQINTLFPKAICKTRRYYFKTNCVCSEKNFLILYIRIPIFSYLYIPNNSLKERNIVFPFCKRNLRLMLTEIFR